MEKCTYCHGLGYVESTKKVGSGVNTKWVPKRKDCVVCDGTGQAPEDVPPADYQGEETPVPFEDLVQALQIEMGEAQR